MNWRRRALRLFGPEVVPLLAVTVVAVVYALTVVPAFTRIIEDGGSTPTALTAASLQVVQIRRLPLFLVLPLIISLIVRVKNPSRATAAAMAGTILICFFLVATMATLAAPLVEPIHARFAAQ